MPNLFNLKNGLEKDGDCAVVGSSGKSGVPVGHLFLQGDNDGRGGWRAKSELDEKWGGNGVGEIAANQRTGGVVGEGFQCVPLDQMKAGFILKRLAKPGDQSLIDFKRFHRVSDGEESTSECTEAGTDFLDGLSGRFGQGVGDDRGQGWFGEKVLAQLAKRAQTVSRQNVANLGRVQS